MSTPPLDNPETDPSEEEVRRLLEEKHVLPGQEDEAEQLLQQKRAKLVDEGELLFDEYGQIVKQADKITPSSGEAYSFPPISVDDAQPPLEKEANNRRILIPPALFGIAIVLLIIGGLLFGIGGILSGSQIPTPTNTSTLATPSVVGVATANPTAIISDAEVAESYRRGRQLFDAGRIEDSAVEFEKAFAIDPTFPDLAEWLSRSYYEIGFNSYVQARDNPANRTTWDNSIEAFERALEVDTDNIDARVALSETYYRWGAMTVIGDTNDTGPAAAHLATERLNGVFSVPLAAEGSVQYTEMQHTRSLASNLLSRVTSYQDGVALALETEWLQSITAFEAAGTSFEGDPDLELDGGAFLDVTERLYNVYLSLAAAQINDGQFEAAQESLNAARRLDVADQSELEELFAQLPFPPPLVTPTRQPVPTSSPRPKSRAFRAIPMQDFQGSGNSGTYNSCIAGKVTYGGAPIGGARVEVNNGPNNRFQAVTDPAGNYQICGLGASTWSVVLYFIPGDPPLARQTVGTFYVNGNRAQTALVNFTGP